MAQRGLPAKRQKPKANVSVCLIIAFDLGVNVANREKGDLMTRTASLWLLFSCCAAGVLADSPAPPAEAFRVLTREVPPGPRITSYLQQQLDLGWSQDEARRAEWARLQGEADLLRLRAQTRQKVLDLIGGLPGERTPLHARLTGSVPMTGYRIEKLLLESLPGVFVTALVYVPDAAAGARPAVLLPCGHSPEGKAYPNYQEIAGRLAARGYVVLCWDPVGQGERSQFWDAARGRSRYNLVCGEHAVLGNLATLSGSSLLRYEVWDGVRALDYLLSRPDVDAKRISITGTSGGGAQSAWIGALDERIGVVAPSCFVTSLPMRMANRIFEDPDSDPEQDPPGLVSEGIDHPGLLLLAYPRAIHVASAVKDFVPIEGARRTVRELRALYQRFGHGDRVGFAQGYHEHRYSDENQERAFAFLDRWNGVPPTSGLASVPKLMPQQLQVTPTGQVRVDLAGRSLVEVIRDEMHAAARTGSGPSFAEWYATVTRPRPSTLSWDKRGSTEERNVSIDRYLVRSSTTPDLLALHIHRPNSSLARVRLDVSFDGKVGAADWPVVERALEQDSVLSFDLRGTGEDRMRYRAASVDDAALAPADEEAAYADPLSGVLANYVYNGLLTGRPYLLDALEDVDTAARFAREALGAKRLAIAGRGEAGLLAVLASRVQPGLELANEPGTPVFSWREAVEQGRERWPIQYLLPGAARLREAAP